MSAARITRIIALALLWGSSFLWIKIALHSFSPIQLTVGRMVLGALALIAFVLLTKRSFPTGYVIWLHLAVAALFGNALPYLLFGLAEQYVSSSTAGVINATTPIWTVLVTLFAYRDRHAVQGNLASIALGFGGVVLIFSPWQQGSQIMSWGGLACLAAAASYGINYTYIGRFLAHRASDSLSLAAGQLTVASLLTVLCLPFFSWHTPTFRINAVLALLILGVLGTGISYILNYTIISTDGHLAASLMLYLLPIVAVVLGVFILGESLSLHVVVGMVVVLTAMALRKPTTNHPVVQDKE